MKLFLLLLVVVGCIFLFRLFGAWLLRIDEVITLLKGVYKEAKEIKEVYKKIHGLKK